MTKKHKQSAKKQVTENLELENFSWGYASIYYEKDSATADVQVIMSEEGSTAENSRIFEIPTPKKFDEDTISRELLKLPAFAGSVPI